MKPLALCLALAALPCACRSQPADPAPPPASYELSVAPPGARGARAAGTDAAPPAPSEGALAPEGDGEGEGTEPEEDSDAGPPNDAGPPSDAAPGVAL